ncbi:MAG: META domain-containing protein [Gemmatimonadota bacterium]
MPLKIVRPLLAVLALVALAACNSAGGAAAEGPGPAASVAGREWRLVELNGRPAGSGAGGRAATLRLDGERAGGFAGCNTFGGGYQMGESSLTFATLAATRMACEQGMELEREYLATLEATRSWRMTPQGLELLGERGVLARFAAA